MTRPLIWPSTLYIVRHGESAGNVARDAAMAANAPVVDIATRDVDVPLSRTGEQQADALGHWFRDIPANEQPRVVISSPYVRARQTAGRILRHAQLDVADPEQPLLTDERLREREFGILDGLTAVGIANHFPEQAAIRAKLGKFYHRPPGGESWCDVILRLRGALQMIQHRFAGERVLVVCHSVVVLCFRYIVEQMTEEDILAIDREHEVANCGVTRYDYDPSAGPRGNLALTSFNFVAPLAEEGAPVTSTPDIPRAPR